MVRRTREKEERKKKKKELQVGKASSSSQECPSGQETTIATSAAGHTVLIRCTGLGDESARTKKTDDESGQGKEVYDEEQEEIEEQEKATVKQESGSTNDDDDESGDEPSVVEFEDPVYELSQCTKWSLNMRMRV